jgi:hypothetical protein
VASSSLVLFSLSTLKPCQHVVHTRKHAQPRAHSRTTHAEYMWVHTSMGGEDDATSTSRRAHITAGSGRVLLSKFTALTQSRAICEHGHARTNIEGAGGIAHLVSHSGGPRVWLSDCRASDVQCKFRAQNALSLAHHAQRRHERSRQSRTAPYPCTVC